MTFGEWLRAQIEAKGVTQRALAEGAGVSPGRVAAYLAGRDEPSLANARLLCRALGAPLAALDREVELKAVEKARKGDGRRKAE